MEVWEEKFNKLRRDALVVGSLDSHDREIFKAGFDAAIEAVLDSFHWHMRHGREQQFDVADIRDPRVPES
jgi:hypothetical protein